MPVSASGLKAEIVTTGTEILLGEIVDTNAAWIAQQLREAGVNLYYKTTVGDNEPRIRAVIEQGMGRSDVIICSGGLGPTVDDVTRHAIANAAGRPLILHEEALATLKERFARFGVEMTANNIQQAYIPEGAHIIPNPVGTAPGFIVETETCAVIALPGVPREMKHLMTETVLPYLAVRAGHTGVIRRRVLRTIGIGESLIDATLGELMYGANPTIGLAAHTGQVDVRITARAENAEDAEQLLDDLEGQVRSQIGRYIYSTTPGESYETVVMRALQARGVTLALLETNTRGLFARRVAAALPDFNPLIAAWSAGEDDLPVVLGENLIPSAQVDTPFSEPQALAAATALRDLSGATFVIAILGSAGADEGIYGKRSGESWIGLAGPSGVQTARVPFGGQDEYTIVRIGNQVLSLLYRMLNEPMLSAPA
jgi:nicotinamide-nucleotide amidase